MGNKDIEIGKFIKLKRTERDLSLKELASLCNTTDTKLSRIENGKGVIELPLLIDLSSNLNFTLNELAESTGFSAPPPETPSSPSMKEIINETAFRVSEETINRIREKYQEPLLKQFNELSNLVKKGREAQEREVLPKNLMPAIYQGKGKKYPVISGAAACGSLTCISEDIIEDWISLPEEFNIKADFIITAKGTCLEQERIYEGYLVFIKQQETCESGNIVAIRVIEKGETFAILKKVKFLSNGTLIFTNGTGDLLELKDNMQIIGRVVYWMPDPRKFI